jgi:CubicO group peptidase (beta-lactamase class C family)
MKRWRTDGAARPSLAALALLLVAAAAWFASANGEPSRQQAGIFSRTGLDRAGDYLRNEIATGKIPGAVILVQQHGHPVYFETLGVIDIATRRPMSREAIFRLYSMSKPITSVAAMMLVEDGRLALDDPLSKYIPAFATVEVAVEKRDADGNAVLAREPLKRTITIEDLLRHTSGLTYGFYGDSPVRRLYANANLFAGDFDNAEFAARIARLPLAEQPGTLWDYGHSTDVLGRVIEVVSGKSLIQFEKERLLDPLGMSETGFYVADPAKRPLIAKPMPGDWFTTPIAGIRDPMLVPRWQSGGAGMIGTAGDYARFAQMLLNGGTLDGRRYLKPETVALMTLDHVGPESGVARDDFYFPGPDSGFGLGFAVRTRQLPDSSLPLGEYRWDGVAGTFFFIDPQDDMFTICMMQTPSQRGRIQTALKKLIYQALGK